VPPLLSVKVCVVTATTGATTVVVAAGGVLATARAANTMDDIPYDAVGISVIVVASASASSTSTVNDHTEVPLAATVDEPSSPDDKVVPLGARKPAGTPVSCAGVSDALVNVKV
jgi:hypothetical protein